MPTMVPPDPSPLHPEASAPPPPRPEPEIDPQVARYALIRRNLAWGLTIGCPLVMALPPRRLNLFTFGLAGLWVMGVRDVLYPMEVNPLSPMRVESVKEGRSVKGDVGREMLEVWKEEAKGEAGPGKKG